METKQCKQCGKIKRATLFSLGHNQQRSKICRACNYDGLAADEKHKIIREAYRHHKTFEQYLSNTGRDIISWAVPTTKGSDDYESITISFSDLKLALERIQLAKRKKEAFDLHILQDMRQEDVAQIMNITPVSVGQYVDQAMRQLAEWYFADDEEREKLEREARAKAKDETRTLN